MDNHQMVMKIAEKYNIQGIKERVESLQADTSLKIGFLGMFSAGKTQLLNTLMGTKLPVALKPTTKAICIIEPNSFLSEEQYFLEKDGKYEPCTYTAATDVIYGDAPGVVVVRCNPKNIESNQVTYIDTPGLASIGDESELTYEYINQLDAAVICINILDGGIKKNLLEFILSNRLCFLRKRMIFAITQADRKSVQECEAVRKKIIETLNENDFSEANIEDRVILVNGTEFDSAVTVLQCIDKNVLTQKDDICTDRLVMRSTQYASDLAELLQFKLNNLELNTDEFDNELFAINRELTILENELTHCQKGFDSMQSILEERILNILQNHEYAITQAEDSADTIAKEFNIINQEITQQVERLLKKYAGDISFAPCIPTGKLANDLRMSMARISATRDLTVQVATAIVTAFILPGAGAAANAAEGLAGSTAASVANAAAKAGKVAGKCAKMLKAIGPFLAALNPLDPLGKLIASEVKHAKYGQYIKSKSILIAENIIEQLQEPYESEILEPMRLSCKEKCQIICELKQKKDDNMANICQLRIELKQDIGKLENMSKEQSKLLSCE